MARVLSFSVDDDLDMENLVERAGYKNRSRFLRDAATHYAEMLSSGDLVDRPSEDPVEGTLVLYYQHTVAKKLPDFRHHPEISPHLVDPRVPARQSHVRGHVALVGERRHDPGLC